MTTESPHTLDFDRYTTKPGKLADEIEDAMRHLALGKAHKLFPHITFREGELMMIVQALREEAKRRRKRT